MWSLAGSRIGTSGRARGELTEEGGKTMDDEQDVGRFAGRFVRPVETGYGHRNPGFVHWYDGDRRLETGWYITPGWRVFNGFAELLPSLSEVDETGIRVCGSVWYRWAGHPECQCTPDCPACYVDDALGTSRIRCKLDSFLSLICPGAHRCVISPERAAEILSRQKRLLVEAERAYREALDERDCQRQIVEMLLARIEEEPGCE